MTGEFLPVALRVEGEFQILAFLRSRRPEVRDIALDDLEAVRIEIKIGDHLRIEEADRIARRRILVAGVKFFRDRGAADNVATFNHAHRQSCGGEIGRAHKAVMAGADDENIRGCGHSSSFRMAIRGRNANPQSASLAIVSSNPSRSGPGSKSTKP